ncbi:phage tail protein [Acidovorax sp. A1169]|jgi:microcystin-dependent protein|uniref:phage tail protein n=1 Tax=Acidovorax sp. A1169 TaxID=3059524 RepID=UPI0027379E5F|nr:tail fiber protein [Acidovorax sp. A1169]MDP4078465.1 tail fiber protein [Acidovorax sp. A1169]
MAQPYVGEIRMFAGNFAPAGWAFCHGQLQAISEYETLFQLIGTSYGGDGQSTFALPDLQSRAPVHQGNGYILAETGGVETVTLTVNQIPAHNHALAYGVGTQASPQGGLLGLTPARDFRYSSATANAQLKADVMAAAGGSQPHDNLSPYLALNFIISLFGIFPSPN